MPDISKISKALDWGKATLQKKEVKDAELSAELLLTDVVNLNRVQLYSNFDFVLDKNKQSIYSNYILRRSKNEPVQYILGYTYFYGLKILCKSGVLIPRPETETLVKLAIEQLKTKNKNALNVLDLCCGSGCISCAIANNIQNSKILAIDNSPDCCNLTKLNVKNNNFNNRISVIQADVLKELSLDTKFDLIICNPPYVPKSVINTLDLEVKDYEPLAALDGGKDGMLFYNQIFNIAKKCLRSDSLLGCEFFEGKQDDINKLASLNGFRNISFYKDLSHKCRFFIAKNY